MVEIKEVAVAVEFAVFETAEVLNHACRIVKSALTLWKAGKGKLAFVNIAIGQYQPLLKVTFFGFAREVGRLEQHFQRGIAVSGVLRGRYAGKVGKLFVGL